MGNDQQYERYQRQIILPGFGEAAQQKLAKAKVLVIGAGGLGCPVLQYLSAAGVGTIGIVDGDVVSLSNLHRQILYSVHHIGQPKSEIAVSVLKQLNHEIDFHCYNVRLTTDNVAEILIGYDIIVDGSDNFPTRYLVNDACVVLDKPLVYGAVNQYEGQVAIFNCKSNSTRTPVNYRDLFPDSPAENEVLNCEEAGVLGVVPGLIGSMMANETIKLITGIGKSLIDRLISYDARNNKLYEIELVANDETRSRIPADIEALKKTDYDWICSNTARFEINAEFFNELLQTESVTVIDVRGDQELPRVDQFDHRVIPLNQLPNHISEFDTDTIVLYCQSGKRSAQAALQLSNVFGDTKRIFSLKGGILQWLQQQKEPV